MANSSRPIRIFLAEDNHADIFLVEMALKEHHVPFTMCSVENGKEALEIVERFGKDEPVPDIALVDLNLPRQEGDQVIRRLRERPCCGSIPIVVMTSSQNQRDREMVERYNATFFSKPVDLSGFLKLGSLVRSLCYPEP